MKSNRSFWLAAAVLCLVILLSFSVSSLASGEFTETPVTTITSDQINPAISGDNVVWQDYRNKAFGCPSAQNCLGADIYVGNLASGGETRMPPGGAGYTSAPSVTFIGGGGSGAAGTATISGGAVTGVTITKGGSGYTSAPTVTFSGGGGSGASGTAVISGGVVTGVIITNGGTGYISAPTVSFSWNGSAAGTATISGGAVTGVTITNGGTGYTSAPAVVFSGGGGLGVSATATVSGGSVTGVTITPNGLDPDIDGNLVVWRNWNSGKIVVHDLATGIQKNASTLTGYQQQTTPAVSGNIVVWTDFRNSSEYGDIYMRDLTQPADTFVSKAAAGGTTPAVKKDKRNPDVSGDIVVWEDMRNAYQDDLGWWHNPDIYMKNLTTGQESAVCTDMGDQYYPVIDGDRILWSDFRNGNWDVYMYDISSGVETRLTNSNYDQSWPSVSGDMVVWKDQRTGNEDIYLARISTGTETVVTNNASSQKLPVIDGGPIAWMDQRAGNWDIYTAEDTVAPVISAAGPDGIFIPSGSTTLTASYSDGGLGVDTNTVSVALDGSPASCTVTATDASCAVSGLADGPHTLTVDVSDLAGNAATQWAGSFDVDTTGPVISNFQPSGWLDADSTTVSADYSDGGAGIDATSVTVSLNGTPLAGCNPTATGVSCPVSGLSDGANDFSVTVADTLGNGSTQGGSFDVDTTGPVISPLTATVPPGSDTVNIDADLSDAGIGVDESTVEVTIDGSPVSGCSLTTGHVSCTVAGLSLGSHSAGVSVDDILGNPGSATAPFEVADTVAPGISGTGPTGMLSADNATINASFSDPAPSSGIDTGSVVVTLDGSPLGGCSVTAAGVSCDVTGLVDGVHEVNVHVSDNSGNGKDSTWSFSVSASGPIIDQLTPANGSTVNNPKTGVSARVTDVDGVNTSSIRFYFEGADVTSQVITGGDTLTYHPGNLADGTYTARVTAEDLSGHPGEQIWTFEITSPKLSLEYLTVYWVDYNAYVQRSLTVDYRMTNPGTGACLNAAIPVSAATNGVIALGPLPVNLGDMGAGATVDYSFLYYVPHGVSQFRATSYATCNDDGGNLYWFASPPPG